MSKNPFQININGAQANNVGEQLDRAMAAVGEANDDIRSAKAATIQKRGFTYQGDKHNSWGLGGQGLGSHGTTGFIGGSPFYGRGLEAGLTGFSLQPFGIGVNGYLTGGGISPSIFAGSGAGTGYNSESHIAKVKMAMAVEAYKGFGIVKNVIDLMCNFATEGLTITHRSPAVQNFYRRWAEAINLDSVIKHIIRSYYKTGNVHVYTQMGLIDDMTYRKMRSTRGSTDDSDILDTSDPSSDETKELIDDEKVKPVSKREIPWKYFVLNPFQMEKIGTKYFGESQWVMVLNEKGKRELDKSPKATKTVDYLDDTESDLPKEFKKLIENRQVVKLDQAKLSTFHYMKDDYEDWADPMVWPVMNDIMYKNSLRAMDMSVVNSTINAITIFKLGSIKDGFVADQRHYKKLSEMLRTPTYSHNIVWNDAISMESNYPPIEKILSQDKYKSVDRDILAGLGIPGILVNGAEGGSFSNAFLQVRTLLERLEEGRSEVMKWIKKQLRLIAEVMGHRQIPTIRFGQMSLRDEEAHLKLIVQLLDRNIISAESVHEAFGYETMIEVERMKREKKLADDDGVMMQFGPFKDPMNFIDQEEMMEIEFDQQKQVEQMKMRQQRKQQGLRQNSPNKRSPNGRPPGINTKQEVKRQTKPKGMGLGSNSIIEYERIKSVAAASYSQLENLLTDMTISSKGVDYKKSLSKEDREALEELIHIVYSNIDISSDISKDSIMEVLVRAAPNSNFNTLYRNMLQLNDGSSADDRRYARIISYSQMLMEE